MSTVFESTARCACCLKHTDSKARRFVLMHPWAQGRRHPVLLCKRCAGGLRLQADDPLLVPEGMEDSVSVGPEAHARRIYAGGAVRLIARNTLRWPNAAQGE